MALPVIILIAPVTGDVQRSFSRVSAETDKISTRHSQPGPGEKYARGPVLFCLLLLVLFRHLREAVLSAVIVLARLLAVVLDQHLLPMRCEACWRACISLHLNCGAECESIRGYSRGCGINSLKRLTRRRKPYPPRGLFSLSSSGNPRLTPDRWPDSARPR
jgi:hypothetical protein